MFAAAFSRATGRARLFRSTVELELVRADIILGDNGFWEESLKFVGGELIDWNY